MDEKLRDGLKPIICRECGLIGKVACVDDCSKLELVANMIEQAFRDAGYRQLPSEKELALWLVGHLEYTSSELAKKLLGKLKGE